MGGLFDVVAAWIAGRPTDNLELFGLTMVFWGRLGKSMLYLAGLTILVDLADPGKLRRRGAASAARAGRTFHRMRRKRQVGRLVLLHETVRDDVAQTVPRRGLILATRPPTSVPNGVHLSLGEYRDFHESVRAALPGEHTCRDRHEKTLCPDQFEYVVRRINGLLADQLPADQRDLIRDAEATRKSVVPYFAVVAILAIAVCMVRADDWVWERTSTSVGILLALVVSASVVLPAVRLALAAVGYRLWGSVLSAYGALLDQTRPLHLLRWVAAGLFLVGGALDLLAS
ncbi:hypothetical protein [Micromonospora sp. bgisy143]|uniref:hypothetical protein n=1 Tax=Micromonospora sp. bgisy143 TaxID=3413790 RepID=UPI003EBD7F59